MNKYSYSGPVMEFERCVSEHWEGTTYAVSEKKARANLVYRFKQETYRTYNTKISLPGKIVMVE